MFQEEDSRLTGSANAVVVSASQAILIGTVAGNRFTCFHAEAVWQLGSCVAGLGGGWPPELDQRLAVAGLGEARLTMACARGAGKTPGILAGVDDAGPVGC